MAGKKSAGYRAAVSGARRLVSLLLLVLVVISIIFLGRTAYRFGYGVFHQEALSEPPGESILVMIPMDNTVREVASILHNAGLIEDEWMFVAQERLSEYHSKEGSSFKGGRYRFSTAQTPAEMMAAMAGDTEAAGEQG